MNDSTIYPTVNQLSIDLFDNVPVVEQPPKPKKQKAYYYLRVRTALGWYFLWKTHTNGGCEWEPEFADSSKRKKPLRYKTLSGARRALHSYVSAGNKSVFEMEVAVWNER